MSEKVTVRIISEDGSEMVEETDREAIDKLSGMANRLGIPIGILFTFVIADALNHIEGRKRNGN
jgi:hypothetical protein